MSDLELARVVDVIEGEQIVVRNFQLFGDANGVFAFAHRVGFPGIDRASGFVLGIPGRTGPP